MRVEHPDNEHYQVFESSGPDGRVKVRRPYWEAGKYITVPAQSLRLGRSYAEGAGVIIGYEQGNRQLPYLARVGPYMGELARSFRVTTDWGVWGCTPTGERDSRGDLQILDLAETIEHNDIPFGASLRVAGGEGYILSINTGGDPVLPARWEIINALTGDPVSDCGEDLEFDADFESLPEDPIFVNVPYYFDLVGDGETTHAYIGWCALGRDDDEDDSADVYPGEQLLKNGPVPDTTEATDVWLIEAE